MLRVSYKSEIKVKESKQKRVPLYKNHNLIQAGKIQFLKDHNAMFAKKALAGKQEL